LGTFQPLAFVGQVRRLNSSSIGIVRIFEYSNVDPNTSLGID
jgi:hypothetical protein